MLVMFTLKIRRVSVHRCKSSHLSPQQIYGSSCTEWFTQQYISNNSNKWTNQMQQFLKCIACRLCTGQTCFGRPHAYQQELNNCSSSLWFHLRSVVIAVLLVVVRPVGRSDHDQQHCYHHAPKVKPEAATAVVELLLIGVRTPETCLTCT
jgi:hypothetical protein